MKLIGYDIGSSSVKATLIDATTKRVLASAKYPELEMAINAPQALWAEQNPEDWWKNLCAATQKLIAEAGIDKSEIKGIGLSYQMHGLVLIDEQYRVLRPAIIWCDSRAVEIGERAFESIGEKKCLEHLLNSPGNFTASKLAWVFENEPEVANKIYKFMLPGDYIAMKMTGNVTTTIPGLAEGMLWDYKEKKPANFLLEYYKIGTDKLPDLVDTCGYQGHLTKAACEELGLHSEVQVTYRAGDQPNNAMSLNVLKLGEVAATGGTSGVVFGILDELKFDDDNRINSFAHVNYKATDPRIGMMLCLNGAGIQYSWLRSLLGAGFSYTDLEQWAATVKIGSDGLQIFPFGNGVERIFRNQQLGGAVSNINFNMHSKQHMVRATLEGIAFAFVYGMQMMQQLGLTIDKLRVGNDNLFLSKTFSTTISTLMGCELQIIKTTGATGAARAAGIALGAYANLEEAMSDNETVKTITPISGNEAYKTAYSSWKEALDLKLLT